MLSFRAPKSARNLGGGNTPPPRFLAVYAARNDKLLSPVRAGVQDVVDRQHPLFALRIDEDGVVPAFDGDRRQDLVADLQSFAAAEFDEDLLVRRTGEARRSGPGRIFPPIVSATVDRPLRH